MLALTWFHSRYPEAGREIPESENFVAHLYFARELVTFKPRYRVFTNVSIRPFKWTKKSKLVISICRLMGVRVRTFDLYMSWWKLVYWLCINLLMNLRVRLAICALAKKTIGANWLRSWRPSAVLCLDECKSYIDSCPYTIGYIRLCVTQDLTCIDGNTYLSQ